MCVVVVFGLSFFALYFFVSLWATKPTLPYDTDTSIEEGAVGVGDPVRAASISWVGRSGGKYCSASRTEVCHPARSPVGCGLRRIPANGGSARVVVGPSPVDGWRVVERVMG